MKASELKDNKETPIFTCWPCTHIDGKFVEWTEITTITKRVSGTHKRYITKTRKDNINGQVLQGTVKKFTSLSQALRQWKK